MNTNSDLNSDIQTLLNVARPNLIAADNGGGSETFNEVCKEFGKTAHRVYLALDEPERSPERYHSKETRRVLLDPWTVLNRAKSCEGLSVDDEEFWFHCDMIKTLCDYIDLNKNSVSALLKAIDGSTRELVNN